MASYLETLTPIGTKIYTHTPSTPPTSLIILCTWLGGASPRRITKYTAGYIEHFPEAIILLITTTLPDITFRSLDAIRARLVPARDMISRFLHLDSGPDSVFKSNNGSETGIGGRANPILLHIFSHGGSNIATQLARSIKEHNPAEHELFTSALRQVIFDCCPGDSSFQRNYNAAAVSLPPASTQPIAHLLGKSVLYPSIGTISALQSLGILRGVESLRAELNDPAVFGIPARRLYLYSCEDEMVRWEDVERHMGEAASKGYVADGMRFEKGPHCALVTVEENQYWELIRRAWSGERVGVRGSRL